jgi:hypothetical protein
MLSGVISDRQESKVLRSVVVLDVVPVVDVLVGSQSSTHDLRHDDTMLQVVSVADSDGDVPV